MLHRETAANRGAGIRIRTANQRIQTADEVMRPDLRVVIGALCFLLHFILTLTG
jgi:hypothetical protein